MKRTVYGALALALLFVGSSLLTAATTVQDLRIGGYALVSKTRIGPHHWHLAYTAKLTNRGTTDIFGATAKLKPFLGILIVDGQLSFGPVAAGQAVPSTDTFTLRWPIARAINPRLLERVLRWNITIANAAPQADAGPDRTVPLNAAVQLDGTGSSDADGDPLTYRWAFTAKPASSTAALTGADTATPAFVADRPGNYDVKLIVNDGQSDSTSDTVRISTANSAPSADAGPDQTAFVGNTVTLDGTASSDVDGDPITYQWSFTTTPAGSQAVLSDPTASRPSFTVDKPGDYLIQLIVNDGKVDSTPDSLQISTLNSPPVADAGPDQSVFVNTAVQLDGSQSSDADGDALTYRWSLLNQPANSAAVLANDTTINPSFTVDKPGSYTVQLIVHDGTVDGAPDQIVVSTQNSRPVANAGADQTATVGDTVTLDGNGSLDADGDNLSFAWSLITQPANSTVALTGAKTATPSFPPDKAGEYIAQLIVSDGQLGSVPDTARVTVNAAPVNQPPVITSTPLTTSTVGQLYSYDVEASDLDVGDTLAYALTAAPAGMVINGTSGLIEWTPTAAGSFDVTVEVKDGANATATQSFAITVSPPAPPQPCYQSEYQTGYALKSECSSCAAAVCAIDSSCCNQVWDSTCVNQAYTTCLGTTPSCTHSELTTGAALAWICTELTGAVCDVLASCCTTTWDAPCVTLANKLRTDGPDYTGNCSEYGCSNAECQSAGATACEICMCQEFVQAVASPFEQSRPEPGSAQPLVPKPKPPNDTGWEFDRSKDSGWKMAAPVNTRGSSWNAILLIHGIENDYGDALRDPVKLTNWKKWVNTIRLVHPESDHQIFILGNEGTLVSNGMRAIANATPVARLKGKILEVIAQAPPNTGIPILIKIYAHSNGAVVVYEAIMRLKNSADGTGLRDQDKLLGRSLFFNIDLVQGATKDGSILGNNLSKATLNYNDGWGGFHVPPDTGGHVDMVVKYFWNMHDGDTSAGWSTVGFSASRAGLVEAINTNHPTRVSKELLSDFGGHNYQYIFENLRVAEKFRNSR